MKYILLKHIDNQEGEEISLGSVFNIDNNRGVFTLSNGGELNINWLIDNGYIEEYKENDNLSPTSISRIDIQLNQNKTEIKRLAKEQKILKYSKRILGKK